MSSSARDIHYGRRGGRWAEYRPGEAAEAFAAWRRERDEEEERRRVECDGQLSLDFDA